MRNPDCSFQKIYIRNVSVCTRHEVMSEIFIARIFQRLCDITVWTFWMFNSDDILHLFLISKIRHCFVFWTSDQSMTFRLHPVNNKIKSVRMHKQGLWNAFTLGKIHLHDSFVESSNIVFIVLFSFFCCCINGYFNI